MRKFFAAFLLIFLIAGAAATTIQSESLLLDLEESEAQATVKVESLTSSDFTYITSADVSSVQAYAEGEKLDCRIETLTIGSEIQCETQKTSNFTVKINYRFNGLVSNGGASKTFRYSHPIYRPTKNFELRVMLPPGAGLTAQNDSSSAISPTDGNTGSDGRRIYVEWQKSPQIGDTLSFSVNYRDFNQSGTDYLRIIGILFVLLLITGIGYLYWRRLNTENLESVYGDLSEDEEDIIELLRENDGEMLQKDVVNATDYSKAKISGVVSELVEKEIVEKEKEGRSNKLRISSRYRY